MPITAGGRAVLTNAPRGKSGGVGGGVGFFCLFSSPTSPRCDLLCRLTAVQENCDGPFFSERISPTPCYIVAPKRIDEKNQDEEKEGNIVPLRCVAAGDLLSVWMTHFKLWANCWQIHGRPLVIY